MTTVHPVMNKPSAHVVTALGLAMLLAAGGVACYEETDSRSHLRGRRSYATDRGGGSEASDRTVDSTVSPALPVSDRAPAEPAVGPFEPEDGGAGLDGPSLDDAAAQPTDDAAADAGEI